MALNQFSQSVFKGMVDQKFASLVISVQLDTGSTDVVPGQLVKWSTDAGKLPVVTASTAATDEHCGVVTYNPMKATVKGGQILEIAMFGTVVYVEASAAINRGTKVAWAAGAKVAAAASGNIVAGQMLDNASANGALARMIVAGPLAPALP